MNKKRVVTFIASSILTIFLASCSSNNNIKDNPDVLIKLPQGTPVTDLNQSTVPQTEFDKAQTKLEMSIMHQTPTPIWVPPVMAKILIMPYIGSNNSLHSYQYVYTELSAGHWLIGKYLSNNSENEVVEKPLAATSQVPVIQKPLQSNVVDEGGIPRTPGVVGTNQPVSQPANNENATQTTKSNASFFEGGAPKKTINTNIPTGNSNDYNQQYFNNTLNAMKSGG